MVEAVYAIDDFPADDLLWRIEWIGGVGYNTNVPSDPPNRRLPGAASGRRNESAQREIALFSNKENRKNRHWPVALHLNCFGVAAASPGTDEPRC